MLIYLAVTFWLMVGLLEAYAIFKLFEGLFRARWINLILLPGTIVAYLAQFLAGLLTGAPVHVTRLINDESVGENSAQPPAGIPVLSPLLMALLPMLAGLSIIVVLHHSFDSSIVAGFQSAVAADRQLAQELKWSLPAWFDITRDMVSLVEGLVGALQKATTWQAWLFVYLTICLAIRMVPLRGNLRSGMAAVVLIGGLTTLLSLVLPQITEGLRGSWSLPAYLIALLTLVLLMALLVRGVHALGMTIAGRSAGKSAGRSPAPAIREPKFAQ